MIAICRLINGKGPAMFLSTSYMGEVVKRKEGWVHLKNAAIVYEALSQNINPETTQPYTEIGIKYYTDSVVTNGVIPIREDDCLFVRDIDDSEETLVGYKDAVAEFRLQKANIQKASVIPSAPRKGGFRGAERGS